jgi:3-deoxy-manno-octulosonate cytidylyltransferase (CMP-KDO synthetase)
MIVQVLRRALEADVGPVVVAAAETEIADAVRAAGGEAVLTDPSHASGSDRIFEALQRFDPDGRFDCVLNLQGDLPTVEPPTVTAALRALREGGGDIGTAAAPIRRVEERANPHVVKAVIELAAGAEVGRALYFTRTEAPWGDGPLYHHIGLYAYRREALARFVRLPPAALELREKLEQLRALANGMRIDVAVVEAVPLGVDTPEDLERARSLLAARR